MKRSGIWAFVLGGEVTSRQCTMSRFDCMKNNVGGSGRILKMEIQPLFGVCVRSRKYLGPLLVHPVFEEVNYFEMLNGSHSFDCSLALIWVQFHGRIHARVPEDFITKRALFRCCWTSFLKGAFICFNVEIGYIINMFHFSFHRRFLLLFCLIFVWPHIVTRVKSRSQRI